jgi:hypothetical protein
MISMESIKKVVSLYAPECAARYVDDVGYLVYHPKCPPLSLFFPHENHILSRISYVIITDSDVFFREDMDYSILYVEEISRKDGNKLKHLINFINWWRRTFIIDEHFSKLFIDSYSILGVVSMVYSSNSIRLQSKFDDFGIKYKTMGGDSLNYEVNGVGFKVLKSKKGDRLSKVSVFNKVILTKFPNTDYEDLFNFLVPIEIQRQLKLKQFIDE